MGVKSPALCGTSVGRAGLVYFACTDSALGSPYCFWCFKLRAIKATTL